jgi:hypothetical protein
MVATYEVVPTEKMQLRSGIEVALEWPHEADGAVSPPLVVSYISAAKDPAALAAEANSVWQEVRPPAEQRSVVRVAIRPTVVTRGLKWENGWPSFFHSTTSTFWHGRSKDGQWADADRGVERVEN